VQPPRRPRRARSPKVALALTLALGLGSGCTKTEGSTDPDARSKLGRRAGGKAVETTRPDPYPLPDTPATVVVVRDPRSVAAAAKMVAPFDIDARASMRWELSRQLDDAWADRLTTAADLTRPITALELDAAQTGGQRESMIRFAIEHERREPLLAALAERSSAGGFGAVELPTRPSRVPPDGSTPAIRRVLAWSPDDGQTLILANSERGLITATGVAEHYAETPIFAHVQIDRLNLPTVQQIPFESAHIRGELGDLEATLTVAADQDDPFTTFQLSPGALPHLLAADDLVAGGSTRWSGYQSAVKRLIGRIATQVDEAPFLVRGWATDLATKFNAVARSWDGRVAAATAEGHLLVAYGSPDAERSGVAVLHFLREAIDGLSMVSSFVGSAPEVTLKKRADSFSGVDVHRVTIKNARSFADSRIAPLFDDKGNLRVAMAFPGDRNAAMIAVGPAPVPRLGAWLSGTAGAEDPGIADGAPIGAMRWAVSGQQARSISDLTDLRALLAVRPDIPPYDVTIRPAGERRYALTIKGPPAPPPPRTVTKRSP
jgi:hypothetical protein